MGSKRVFQRDTSSLLWGSVGAFGKEIGQRQMVAQTRAMPLPRSLKFKDQLIEKAQSSEVLLKKVKVNSLYTTAHRSPLFFQFDLNNISTRPYTLNFP